MKVILAIMAFTALLLSTKSQEIFNGSRNQTRWNKPQWIFPAFNTTASNTTGFNRTQWTNPHLNRSQWINQFPNEAFNRTNHSIKLGHYYQHRNQTQWQFQSPHNRIKNITIPNWPKWNITSPHRPRRSDPKWVGWNQTTHNGDLILGQVAYLDRLLFNQTYKKESRWWSGREKIIEYPKDLPGKYGNNRQETIYAIRIYNKFLDGLDAEARILSGGVGYRYAKIQLSSPWNRGFKYLVQLFGH